MRYPSKSPADTACISLLLAKKLKGGDVVFLRGGLGSGKTTLIKGLARYFGVRQMVRSPSFVLAKPYPITHPGHSRAHRLIHIDAYRMTSAHDLESIGWSEFAGQAQTIVVVENPGRLFGRYRPTLVVQLHTLTDNRRVIEF
jgi:tRNA threonylcarbamoyl adenosine modification protein YjeE